MRPTRLLQRAVIVLTAGLLMAVASHSMAAAAQPPPDDTAPPAVSIEVLSASPWVDPEGTWSTQFKVTGAPADAEVSYSLRQPPTGTEAAIRQALDNGRDGRNEPKVMRAPVAQPLATLTDASGVARLDIALRSGRSPDRDRILVPNAGVYPVVVSVLAADGTTLSGATLYLNRLPAGDSAPSAPFRLGILLQPERLGGFDARGDLDINAALRTSISETADLLSEADGLPVRLVLSPESIVAMTQSTTPGDLQLIDRLRRSLGDASIQRVPWADLHLEGWASSGTLNTVQTSLIDGQQALFGRLLRQTDVRLWPPDPTLGPDSIGLLSKMGISGVVVDPTQLTDAKPPASESGYTRPFRVGGSGEASLSGVALDPELQTLLANTSDSPGLVAHQIITLMFGEWLADDHERGSVVSVDQDTDPKVVQELFAALTSAPVGSSGQAIKVVDPSDVIALPAITVRQSGKDVAWTRSLTKPAEVPRVAGIADRLETARPLVDDYAAIVPRGDPVAARMAIVIQRSLDRRLAPSAQEALLDGAIRSMESDLDKVSASKPSSLRVTARRTSIPLRFTNDMGRPIHVRLRLQSPRLNFLDGTEQSLTLNPGLNRLDVAVEVRASGQFTMQAELVAPGSDRVLASTRQQVRSTTFSGVGLMLSGVALLFLVVWWSRTLRRRDGDEPGDDSDSEGDEAATPEDAEVAEGRGGVTTPS